MRSLLAFSEAKPKEEKLVLRLKADNEGDIYIPVGGYSQYGLQNCEYNWNIKIDDGEAVNYSGIGSATAIRVGYGLSPLSTHTVRITPVDDDYMWLRAFGYHGTGKASSLVNIISDKSYKGFAVSEINTGGYYKAYQYYGCTNLINTDDELLPDTLQIIGNNYRAYEYYGCTKLKNNAEEKILKSVKAIGNNFRAHQYEGCTSITKVGIRAINWASVGSGYRDSMFTSAFNNRNKATISIEGGIVEGGDLGLNDGNIKEILVYTGLVTDYQTKLSTITSSKIRAKTEWDNNNYEYIDITALADSSGKIRIPVAGYSTTGTQDCAYDWMISIDGGEATEYSGTGSATYISIGSGLTSGTEHRVVIEPKTVAYGWGRAFGYYNSGAEGYIKELTHDSYKCFASSYTSTGNYYKYRTYYGCTSLLNSYEKLPTSVTTIGDYYMKETYKSCTALTTAFYEVLHDGITIGTDYRSSEYYGCTALTTHDGVCGYKGTTYPTNYKSDYLTNAGSSLNLYMTKYEALTSGLSNSLGLSNSNVSHVYCNIDDIYNYGENENWSNINDNKFTTWYAEYPLYEFYNINRYTKLVKQQQINTTFYIPYGSVSSWYVLTWGISVNRYKNFNKIAIAAGENGGYGKYGSDTPQAKILEYGLTKAGDLATISQDYTAELASRRSSWSGSNYTFTGGQRYLRKGGIQYLESNNQANNDYKYFKGGIGTSGGKYGGGDITHYACGVSDNGYFAWGFEDNAYKYRLNDRESGLGNKVSTNVFYHGLCFSSDGKKMYANLSGSDFTITEYSMEIPWDTANAVSTGRTINYGGTWDMSIDGKYLFIYKNGYIYQYTYE